MRALKPIFAFLLIVMTGRSFAGGGHYSCKEETQTCLNEMAAKLKTRGWVGIEMDMDKDSKALLVKRVVEDSPAQAAGLQKGDKLVALNGIKFGEEGSEAKLKVAKETMVPGTTVTYTVNRAGKEQLVNIKLGELPQQVLATWIGEHMMEHHAKVQIAAKTPPADAKAKEKK